jgi:hypothetical protein
MIVIEVALVSDSPALSVTLTEKLNVPDAVGVPDSSPVEVFRVTPAGRLPEVIDQVNGLVPPVTVSWSE